MGEHVHIVLEGFLRFILTKSPSCGEIFSPPSKAYVKHKSSCGHKDIPPLVTEWKTVIDYNSEETTVVCVRV